MIVVFPVGVTFTYFVSLWRKRDRLRRPVNDRLEDEEILWCVFLWEAYKPEYWWWEVLETARRLSMTGLLSTIAPGTMTQLSAGLLMATGSTVGLAWARPYEELRDNVVATLSGCVLVLVFIAAILTKSVNTLDESNYDSSGIGSILIACYIFCVVLFVAWAYHAMQDMNSSSEGLASKALKKGISNARKSALSSKRFSSMFRGSGGSSEGIINEDGVEMKKPRKGSSFKTDNPLRTKVSFDFGFGKEGEGEGGGEGGRKSESCERKKSRDGLFQRFENEMLRRSYERELKRKPIDKSVQRDKQYEEPPPGPPPSRKKAFAYEG